MSSVSVLLSAGYETSESRRELVSCLDANGYRCASCARRLLCVSRLVTCQTAMLLIIDEGVFPVCSLCAQLAGVYSLPDPVWGAVLAPSLLHASGPEAAQARRWRTNVSQLIRLSTLLNVSIPTFPTTPRLGPDSAASRAPHRRARTRTRPPPSSAPPPRCLSGRFSSFWKNQAGRRWVPSQPLGGMGGICGRIMRFPR